MKYLQVIHQMIQSETTNINTSVWSLIKICPTLSSEIFASLEDNILIPHIPQIIDLVLG